MTSPSPSPSADKPTKEGSPGTGSASASGAPASTPSTVAFQSVAWFPPVEPPEKKGGLGSSLAKLGVGLLVGGLLYATHRTTAAYVVWAVAGAVGGVSLASQAAREAIDGLLARFGRAVGSVIGAALLTVVYALVVTPTRLIRRAVGTDDLHLRDRDRATYWLPCDTDERKVRYVGSMFATEVAPTTGHPLRTALLSIVALVLLAEGVSRFYGFGHTVLYHADPDVGYYPQESAELVRYGGRVATNKFSMRSPEITRTKPPGVFRIFMIGDSTLYAGSYVDQADIYASQLEKRLNAGGLPGKVEVLAMGCNGWGPFHERGYVRKYPDVFQADLALVQMPIDDVVRPLYGLAEVPFFPVQDPPRFGLEEIFNSAIAWRYREEHNGKDDAWEARQAPIGIHEYGLLTDDLQRAGAEVMYFVLPSKDEAFGKQTEKPQYTQWRQKLTETVGERGVKLEYAEGHFANRGVTPDEMYHDGVHLNPVGHHIYAEFLEAKIKSDSARFRAWQSGQPAPTPAGPQARKPTDSNTQPAATMGATTPNPPGSSNP